MTLQRFGTALIATAFLSCGGTLAFESDAEIDTTESDTGGDTVTDPGTDTSEDTVTDSIVDTPPPDSPPTCVAAGCWMMPDGGPPCCEGLDYVASCPPSDPTCPTPAYHCVDCGNGTCDPHETAWNCLSDCHAGCEGGAAYGYTCGPMEGYDCSCDTPECRVVCEMVSYTFQWHNTCSDETYGTCSPTDDAECLYIGTDSEGWYFRGPMGGENLLTHMDCAPTWTCYGYD